MTTVRDRLRALVEKARQRLLEVEACLVAIDDLAREEANGLSPPHRAFMEAWNTATQGTAIAACLKLTPARITKVKARLAERPLHEWEGVFHRVVASSFCCGQNERGWVASFEWIIHNADNSLKVLEGKYDDRCRALPLERLPESVRTLLRHEDPYDPNA